MVGNVYGVDVNLSKPLTQLIPKLIELNGCGFGGHFFKYEAGFSYYKKFMSQIALRTNGKPIFIKNDRTSAANTFTTFLGEKDALDTRVLREEVYKYHKKLFGDQVYLDPFWIEDEQNHAILRLSKIYQPRSGFYLEAARSLGIEAFAYDSINIYPGKIEFIYNGKSSVYSSDDIGVIWAKGLKQGLVPEIYQHLFLNDSLTEGVLSSKTFTRFILDPETENKIFPRAISVGVNGKSYDEIIEFLESLRSDLVVHKIDAGSQGVGIRIINRELMVEQLNLQRSKFDLDVYCGVLHSLYQWSTSGTPFEEGLQIIEEFVPSIPIYNPNTDQVHAGNARVVVFAPHGEKPIAIDSQWRLASEPMNSGASLEQRFRANLSRGATLQVITPQHKRIMEEHAVMSVLAFEKTLETFIRPNVEFVRRSIRNDGGGEIKPLDAVRGMYFLQEMDNTLQKTGKKGFSEEISLPNRSLEISASCDELIFDLVRNLEQIADKF